MRQTACFLPGIAKICQKLKNAANGPFLGNGQSAAENEICEAAKACLILRIINKEQEDTHYGCWNL